MGTLLEKLGFQQLVEETLKVKRQTRVMPVYRFILAMVLACYVGFSRLHHLRFLQREPMLTGILGCCGSRRNVPSGGSWPRCTAAWPANCWRCSGACGSESGKRPTFRHLAERSRMARFLVAVEMPRRDETSPTEPEGY